MAFGAAAHILAQVARSIKEPSVYAFHGLVTPPRQRSLRGAA
jgi:hypothetical protein